MGASEDAWDVVKYSIEKYLEKNLNVDINEWSFPENISDLILDNENKFNIETDFRDLAYEFDEEYSKFIKKMATEFLPTIEKTLNPHKEKILAEINELKLKNVRERMQKPCLHPYKYVKNNFCDVCEEYI